MDETKDPPGVFIGNMITNTKTFKNVTRITGYASIKEFEEPGTLRRVEGTLEIDSKNIKTFKGLQYVGELSLRGSTMVSFDGHLPTVEEVILDNSTISSIDFLFRMEWIASTPLEDLALMTSAELDPFFIRYIQARYLE